jgi:hypothetical protein
MASLHQGPKVSNAKPLINFDYLFFSITMELFNKALFLSQQKIFALTHRRVYTLMVNLFQILNQFVLLFRKNVIDKSSMIWRVLPLVKINTRISEPPVYLLHYFQHFQELILCRFYLKSNNIWQHQHGLDCSFLFPWIQKKRNTVPSKLE